MARRRSVAPRSDSGTQQGPASLLGWDLRFHSAADEAAFQRSANGVSQYLDCTWAFFLSIAGFVAIRMNASKSNFDSSKIYMNGCSHAVPVVLCILCPALYLENRRWLLTLIKAKHMLLSPWRSLTYSRLDSWGSVLFSLVISSRTWLQLGHSLFWSTGLHYEMLSTGLWVVVILARTPMFCSDASAAGEASPVLRRIDAFLAQLSSNLLAGLSGGRAAPAPLHEANVCPLTMAYLTVVLGCILPLTTLLYFERTLRYHHATRILEARAGAAPGGGLQEQQLYVLTCACGLGLAAAVGLCKVVELLDALFPAGISPALVGMVDASWASD